MALFLKRYDIIALIILLCGFIVMKFNDLFLPYFWDEAWSYIPAIKEMVKHKPSLLPNSISPELYRGHPLLFYFLSSLWITFFREAIWITKILPLLLSILLLISIFQFGKKWFDSFTALLAVLLLMIQSVFIAQSTFLLPEILLSLFTILSIHNYLKGKVFLTLTFLTATLFTKESGLVIWGTIILFEFIKNIRRSELTFFTKIVKTSYYLIPLILISLFFIYQKHLVGWYFFPKHVSYISIESFNGNFIGYISYLLIFLGRNGLTFLGIISLIVLIITKSELLKSKARSLSIITVFVIAYLIFSSLNFYSPRYLLSIMPLTIMVFTLFIKTAMSKYKSLFTVIIFAIIIFNNLIATFSDKSGQDHTLGHRDLIQVQLDMVELCENKNLYEDNITTHFLMYHNLTNNELGYLSSERVFKKVSNSVSTQTKYVILSSNELDRDLHSKIKNKGTLVQRFEKNESWTELYKLD